MLPVLLLLPLKLLCAFLWGNLVRLFKLAATTPCPGWRSLQSGFFSCPSTEQLLSWLPRTSVCHLQLLILSSPYTWPQTSHIQNWILPTLLFLHLPHVTKWCFCSLSCSGWNHSVIFDPFLLFYPTTNPSVLSDLPSECVLYTNTEQSKKEIKKIFPFTIAPKRVKYLGINLTMEVKDLYHENYKTFLKELKEDI